MAFIQQVMTIMKEKRLTASLGLIISMAFIQQGLDTLGSFLLIPKISIIMTSRGIGFGKLKLYRRSSCSFGPLVMSYSPLKLFCTIAVWICLH
jgi:hypothetical protein